MSEYGFFVTADDIYRWLKEGPGAESLNLAQGATQQEMDRENQRADQIIALSNAIQAGWQGEAGGRAYSAASPLAEHALRGAEQLRVSQDLLSRQSASFVDAANRVQPVPEKPPENSLSDEFPFDNDIDKETADYQAAAQNNFSVFREYDGASSYNETHMPQEYNTTNRSTGNVTVTPPADTIEVDDAGPGSGPRSGGPGEYSGGPGNYSGYGAGPSGYPGGPSGGPPAGGGYPGPVPSGGQQTTPNDYRPSPQPPYPYPPAYPPVNRPSPVSADPGNYTGGAPYGGGSGGGSSGGFGPRGSGGGGGYGGGPRGFGPTPGPGPGAAAGALAAEEAAARRAAQAAAGIRPGAAGGQMGAPMGAARNKDDEDTEHERKILIETDAEETFGSDVLTAPQVIGDDEYED
jgi:hypothetical protein